jgi:hypothetical protein
MTMKIMLKSIDDVKVFVNEVNKVSCDVDLASGRYVVELTGMKFRGSCALHGSCFFT